ncbi:MAG: PilZ domain-containing protein [Spirochaetales bacterium]|nr:PilZ domain-containing protein [Spirochaetales bacterium]
MIKKTGIVHLILFISFLCYAEADNIVQNGSFEFESSGYITQWNTEAFLNNNQAVRFYVTDKEFYKGKKSFGIANIQPNDSKIIQWVNVKPDSLYRLSGWIKAKKVEGAPIGANITILGIKGSSESIKESNDKWVYVEVYGKTGPRQKELAIIARLGFYGNLVTGIAYFDEIAFEKVTNAPEKQVLNFDSTEEKYVYLEDNEMIGDQSGSIIVTLFILLCSITGLFSGVIFLYVYIIRPFIKKYGLYFNVNRKTMIEDAGSERRKNERKKLKLTIIVRCPTRSGGYNEMVFNSLNISIGGVFIIVDDISLFRVGDRIEIEIEKKGKRYNIGKAYVVRLQKEHDRKGVIIHQGIGVQFFTTDATHITWLMSIMGETPEQKKIAKSKRKQPPKRKTKK